MDENATRGGVTIAYFSSLSPGQYVIEVTHSYASPTNGIKNIQDPLERSGRTTQAVLDFFFAMLRKTSYNLQIRE